MSSRPVSGRPRRPVPLPVALLAVLLLAVAVAVVSARLDVFAWFVRLADEDDHLHLQEVAVGLVVALVGVAVVCFVRIGRAHRTSLELARTSQQFRSLFDYHPHAVFSLGMDGQFSSANTAAERVSGWPEESLRRMSFRDLVHPDSLEELTGGLASMVLLQPRQLEITVKHRRGRLVQLNLTVLPIVVNKKVVGTYGIARDVTKQNGILRELRRANVAAERAAEAKSAFLANISHEIRTPLTSLLTGSELLADTELDPLQASVVESLTRSGLRLQRLVDNVLDFSKLEAGRMELEVVDLDVRALVDDAVAMFVHVAGRKGVRVHADVDPEVPDVLTGDPARIQQVLHNLVGNAAKFTADGSIVVGVTVSDTASDTALDPGSDPVELIFSVTDTGIGMSPDQRGRLFQSFTQADPSITRRYGGTGLGLVISRNLVALMGGTIWVTSTPGEGSTFSVRLPLGPPTARSVEMSVDQPAAAPARGLSDRVGAAGRVPR